MLFSTETNSKAVQQYKYVLPWFEIPRGDIEVLDKGYQSEPIQVSWADNIPHEIPVVQYLTSDPESGAPVVQPISVEETLAIGTNYIRNIHYFGHRSLHFKYENGILYIVDPYMYEK